MSFVVDFVRRFAQTGVAGQGGKVFDIGAVAGSRLLRQGVLLVAMAIAARLLGKELLGVWAIINIVIQFGVLLSDGGISTFVIREKELDQKLYATAYFVCVLLSIVVAAISAGLILPISSWLGYANFQREFLVATITIVPLGISAIAQAKLRRDRKFGTILIVDFVANSVLLAGVVWMLLSNYQLWSLVSPMIVSASISALGCSWLSGIPRWHIDQSSLRKVIDYSAGLFGASVMNFWTRNADHVLIGRYLGAAPLGIYSVAYRIMMLPLTQINTIATTVALPYMSPHQDDHAKLRQLLRQLLASVGAITIIPILYIWLQRNFVIELILGGGWEHVADLLAILVPLSLFQTVASPLGLCFQISGKTRLLFKIGLVQSISLLTSFAIGVWLGSIDHVVYCYTVAILVASPIAIYFSLQTIGSHILDWFSWNAAYFICLPICWSLHRLFLGPVSPVVDALLATFIGGSAAVFTLRHAFERE